MRKRFFGKFLLEVGKSYSYFSIAHRSEMIYLPTQQTDRCDFLSQVICSKVLSKLSVHAVCMQMEFFLKFMAAKYSFLFPVFPPLLAIHNLLMENIYWQILTKKVFDFFLSEWNSMFARTIPARWDKYKQIFKIESFNVYQ